VTTARQQSQQQTRNGLVVRVVAGLSVTLIVAVVAAMAATWNSAKENSTQLAEHCRRIEAVERHTKVVIQMQARQEFIIQKQEVMDSKLDHLLSSLPAVRTDSPVARRPEKGQER